MGSRESFSEELRVNTALVRRRLRTPRLRIAEEIVGRESLTPVVEAGKAVVINNE